MCAYTVYKKSFCIECNYICAVGRFICSLYGLCYLYSGIVSLLIVLPFCKTHRQSLMT